MNKLITPDGFTLEFDQEQNVTAIIGRLLNQSTTKTTKKKKTSKGNGNYKIFIESNDLRQSWDLYLQKPFVSIKEISQRYGVRNLTPLRLRWERESWYDPVADYKRALDSGLQGKPLQNLYKRVELAGRVNEIDGSDVEIRDADEKDHNTLLGDLEVLENV